MWNSDAVASLVAVLYLKRCMRVIVATSAVLLVLQNPASYTLLPFPTALNGTLVYTCISAPTGNFLIIQSFAVRGKQNSKRLNN